MASDHQSHEGLEHLELDLFLEAIYRYHGYDFRSYSKASMKRRVRQLRVISGHATIADMIPRVLHDRIFFEQVLKTFSISVTEFFRDPYLFNTVREKLVPLLKTWPNIKIWHAGCATGEEVYSLAILLKEEGLYDRTTIYATDFSSDALEQATAGIYEPARLQEGTRNYQKAGGARSFSEYYHAKYGAAVMDPSLKERLVFSNHNLATDGVFGEMHLIFCRNVLIYFNRELQDRALGLFAESLTHGGFLCLGSKESIRFSQVQSCFKNIDDHAKIYKKQASFE